MAKLEIYRPMQLTRWQRLAHAVRSFTLGPFNAKDPALARLFRDRSSSSAGVPVNENTALNYSAVWAAVNLISSHIGAVPLNLYKRLPDGGKERFDTHPLHRLIHDRPNQQMPSNVFRRTLQAHVLVWGNGYAEIERDQAGRPVALWPLLPHAVEPVIERGVLRYRVYNPGGSTVMLEMMDVLHVRGHSDDGICGQSVIGRSRESIGLGLAAERFGATFFGNGATFGGIISYPQGLATNPSVREDNRKAIEGRHQGVDRAHRLLALYEGAKYEQLGVPPNEAQFLETRKFQIEEVCRWFNLPPHKMKHLEGTATYASIEHLGIDYVTDTLDPWWVTWEKEMQFKLIAPLEQGIQLIEHVREGLLRGDQAGRGEYYSKLFSVGAITINEIRSKENLNPVAGGDTVYVPLNTMPLDRLNEWLDAQIKSKEQPKPIAPPKPEPSKEEQEEKAARQAELEAARKAAQEWEDKHDVAVAQLHEAKAATAAAEAGRDEARTAARGFHEELQALGVNLTLESAKREVLEAQTAEQRQQIADLTLAYQYALADVEAWTSQANEHRAAAAQFAAERDEAAAERDAARVELDAAASRLADAVAAAAQMAAERDEQIAGRQRDKDAAQAHAEAAEAAKRGVEAERDATADSLKAAQALLDEAARAAEAERAEYQKRLDGLVTAQRHVFADAMGRMVRREIAKAKNYQANPRKLSTWVESFYDKTEEDIFVEALLPAARLHVAWMGSSDDPVEFARGLAREHFAESIRTLNAIVEAGPEGFGDVLQRTLGRWESTRADQLADRVMEQEIRHGR